MQWGDHTVPEFLKMREEEAKKEAERNADRNFEKKYLGGSSTNLDTAVNAVILFALLIALVWGSYLVAMDKVLPQIHP